VTNRARSSTEPKNPRNIPARENLAVGDPPLAAKSPGDANPDLNRSATPGPVPSDPVLEREHAGPSEAATADIKERQKGRRDDADAGRPAADAPYG
jgi:hypothetical protein